MIDLVDVVNLIVVLAYVSLAVELAAFPVPSKASSWSLMQAGTDRGSDRLARARALPSGLKLVALALPTALCVAIVLLPLAMVFRPELRQSLGPVDALSSSGLALIGAVLVVLGRALTFSSVLSMRGGSKLFRPARPDDLKRSRLFAKSRNPGLVGMFLFYAGLVLIFPSWALLLGVPFYYGHMHLRVLLEESDLETRFGESYREYASGTRRYL